MENFFTKLFSRPDALVFHRTAVCAECGSRLCAARGEEFGCPNPDCPAQIRLALAHWCSPEAMDIPGGTETVVAELVSSGLVRDVAELYRLKLKELERLGAFDSTTAPQFLAAISGSKQREAWRALFGLGIPLLDAAQARALMGVFRSVDDALSAGLTPLTDEAGIQEATARSILHWHGDSLNRKLLKRLDQAKLNLKNQARE